MKVISGRLGGRSFDSPGGHRTHPMSDKMRGAIFNVLGDIEGLTVLDAFAGSGALGIEALSRGVSTVTAIEIDKAAWLIINKNAQSLGLQDAMKIIRANASSWSRLNSDALFDLIFSDPPYNKLQLSSQYELVKHLKPTGVFVLSWPGAENPPNLPGLHLVSQKDYGDSQLIFYKWL